MPRTTRQPSPTGIYHWIIRGIHRKQIFHDGADFRFFLDLVQELKAAHQQKIYHYCLMDNHVHMLVFSESVENLSSFSHFLLRRYVYHYCHEYKWIGALFQGRYKAVPIDDERYLLECGRYIERNPLKAHIALHPEDYEYSSLRFYIGQAKSSRIDPSPAFLALDDREEVRQRMYECYVKSERIEESKKAKQFKLV